MYAPAPQSDEFIYKTVYVGDQPGDFIDTGYAYTECIDGRPNGEWCRIIVRDATFVQGLATPDRFIIEAENPGGAVFIKPEDAAFSTLNTYGGTFLLRGVHLILPASGAGSGTYAMHHHPGPNGRAVFDQVIFESQSADREQSVGADTDKNSITYFNQCTFRPHGGVATNLHGAANDRASMYVFKDCVIDAGSGHTGYNDGGSGMPDEVWVRGGNIPHLNLSGPNVHGWVDPVACPDVTVDDGATYEELGPDDWFPPMWDEVPA